MEDTMKKHVIKRTIRYWGYQVERSFGILIVVGIIYGIIFGRNHVGDTREMVTTVFTYMMMIGLILMLIMPMSYAASNIPMILSMGSGRKEALLGMQFGNTLLLVQMLLLLVISWPLVTMGAETELIWITQCVWKAIITLLFLAWAISQFGAWFQMRYGSKGSVIYTILFVVILLAVGLGCGIVVGMNSAAGGFKYAIIAESFQSGLNVGCVVAAVVSVIVYVIGYRLLKKTIMNYEIYR